MPENTTGGGEYQVQQGFGWTNGVTSRFYTLLR
ncbi:trehalase family glycosidase [Pseudoalteromonas sp. MMG005]|nr:trehalase family glycosidase [Pseudoalteromonas sp. MMG005]